MPSTAAAAVVSLALLSSGCAGQGIMIIGFDAPKTPEMFFDAASSVDKPHADDGQVLEAPIEAFDEAGSDGAHDQAAPVEAALLQEPPGQKAAPGNPARGASAPWRLRLPGRLRGAMMAEAEDGADAGDASAAELLADGADSGHAPAARAGAPPGAVGEPAAASADARGAVAEATSVEV